MKSETKKNILMIFAYTLFAGIWCAIGFATLIFFIISDFIRSCGNGILKVFFIMVFLCAVFFSVLCCKKFKSNRKKLISLIILIISAVAVNASVFALTYTYFSHFTKTKWERNEQVRIYMINDLESKHEIIGKSEQEIIDLLGKPSNVAEYGLKTYEYYIGDDLIDPYTYNIGFENGIAKYANISQH